LRNTKPEDWLVTQQENNEEEEQGNKGEEVKVMKIIPIIIRK